MLERKINLQQFAALNLIFLFIIWGCMYFSHAPLVSDGPPTQLYLVAKNILNGGDLHLPDYDAYDELLRKKSLQEHRAYWQDMYSIDRNGVIILKHSHLMVALLLPFLFVFGDYGILVLGGLMYVSLQCAIFYLAKRDFGITPTLLSGIAVICGTPFLFHAAGIDYDLVAAAFVAGALVLSKRAPFTAGLLIGMTAFFRPSHVLYLPFFLYFLPCFETASARRALLSGCIPVLALLAAYNWILWESPFATSYTRMPNYIEGMSKFSTANTTFSLKLFLTDWSAKLFAFKNGFFPFNGALVSLFLLPLCWKEIANKRTAILFLLTAAVQAVLIFSFDGWQETFWGNRFLFPVNGLMAILAIVVIVRMQERVKGRGELQ